MKNRLLLATALSALSVSAFAADLPSKVAPAALPVLATPAVTGFVGVDLGYTRFDGNYRHAEQGGAFAFGGLGRANMFITPNVSVQIDAETEGTTGMKQYTGSTPAAKSDGRLSNQIGAHVAYRNSDFALGAFGGITSANNLDWDGQMVHGIVGGEAQAYLGAFTLYGQAGFIGRVSGANEYEPKALGFGRAVARYFVTPNDKLQVEFGYAMGDTYANPVKTKITTWGASVEHRFAGPVAITASYDGFKYQMNSSVNEHTFKGGLRFYFDNGTLLSQDRTGATFDMPKFGRAMPWAFNASR